MPNHPRASEITPHTVYEQRRQLIRLMASGVVGSALGIGAIHEAQAALAAAPSRVAGALVLVWADRKPV